MRPRIWAWIVSPRSERTSRDTALRGQRSAEITDDPVHLDEQRRVAEPLAFDLGVIPVTVVEGEPCPAKGTLEARCSTGPHLGE